MSVVENPKANKELGIVPYHRLGPLCDLRSGEVRSSLVTTAVERLSPGEIVSPKESEVFWFRNLRNPDMYAQQGLSDFELRDVASLYRDLGDSCELVGDHKGAALFYESSITPISTDPSTHGAEEMFAINEAKSWLINHGHEVIEFNPGTHAEEPYSQRRSRKKIVDKIIAERRVRDGGLVDGKAFEMALVSLIQYQMFYEGTEDQDNSARMARTREDQPAIGMPREVGTRVAHDIVVRIEGCEYRVQAKFGTDQQTYDTTKIVVLEESDMTSQQLTAVFEEISRAYSGDKDAAARTIALAEKYITKIISGPRYSGGKLVELAFAAM